MALSDVLREQRILEIAVLSSRAGSRDPFQTPPYHSVFRYLSDLGANVWFSMTPHLSCVSLLSGTTPQRVPSHSQP